MLGDGGDIWKVEWVGRKSCLSCVYAAGDGERMSGRDRFHLLDRALDPEAGMCVRELYPNPSW